MATATTTQVNEQVRSAMAKAQSVAAATTQAFLTAHGDRDCCGFAWVTTYVKGNTRLGKALLANGFKKAYGGGLQWWNPSANYTQCITAKEEGARAAADKLAELLGEKFYAGSRMD